MRILYRYLQNIKMLTVLKEKTQWARLDPPATVCLPLIYPLKNMKKQETLQSTSNILLLMSIQFSYGPFKRPWFLNKEKNQ